MAQTLRRLAAGLIVAAILGRMPQNASGATGALEMRVLILNHAGVPPEILTAAERAAARVFDRIAIQTNWQIAGVTAGGSDLIEDDLSSAIIVSLLSEAMEAPMKAPPTVVGMAVPGGRLAELCTAGSRNCRRPRTQTLRPFWATPSPTRSDTSC